MSYSKIVQENRNWIDETFEKLNKKLSRTAVKSRNKIPYTSKNGEHDNQAGENGYIYLWTNGFWGGLMWLMYAATGNEDFKETAKVSEKLLDKVIENIHRVTHDVGFMWHILSGASYRLTGDLKSRNRNLLMAMTLASRYNVDGNYIRVWDREDAEGWTIIDCMMNINQLYWASNELGDARFKRIAMRYADMAMRDHVREDGSVNHIVVHDTEKDLVLGTRGGQGYAEGSCWSRGASWAVYGFILSYIHTGKKEYLETAIRTADYFIDCIEKTEYLPLLDFKAPETPVYYDSTAGAIAACGFIEIAKNLPEEMQDKYINSAIKLLKALEKNWCNWEENEDSILQMGSENYRKGIHKPIIYGDYFFAEAIIKLKGVDFLPW